MTTEAHQAATAQTYEEAGIAAGKATMYAIAEYARADHPTAKVVVLSESDQGSWLWIDHVETDASTEEELDDDGGYASCLYTDVYSLRELYSEFDERGAIESTRRTGITSFRMDVAKVLAECAPEPVVDERDQEIEALRAAIYRLGEAWESGDLAGAANEALGLLPDDYEPAKIEGD